MRRTLLLCSLPLLFSACTHLKGVVLTDPTNRPLTTAQFSVGNPAGISVYATYNVNKEGVFDFYLLPIDENNLYLYDTSGDPQLTLRRVDRTQFSEKMLFRIRPPKPDPFNSNTIPQLSQ